MTADVALSITDDGAIYVTLPGGAQAELVNPNTLTQVSVSVIQPMIAAPSARNPQ